MIGKSVTFRFYSSFIPLISPAFEIWHCILLLQLITGEHRIIVQCLYFFLVLCYLSKLFTHVCLCSPNSINWYLHKLGAKQALHSTLAPCTVRGLAASAGVWLRAIEMEISTPPPMGPCGSGRTQLLSVITTIHLLVLWLLCTCVCDS